MNWALGIRMVSSRATLTQRGILCTPLITLLTVSSMVALIFCFAFPTTLQGCMPASTSHFDEHSRAVSQTTLYRSYRTANTMSLVGYLHYNTPIMASVAVIPPATPSFVIVNREHLLSASSHTPLEAQLKGRVYQPLLSSA